ncbi:MAG: DUF917 domain-containing protein [Actinobacteria bacterium]|nr:DUF917 domain-containing protein [Actinomycetota bacterium]
MPEGSLSSEQDVEDFERGTAFLAASGGGPREMASGPLLDDLERGLEPRWIDLPSLADDALVACTFYSGSIAPDTFDTAEAEREAGVERITERLMVEATRQLEAYLGEEIDALIALEIGGVNTGLVVDAAANLGKPALDADYAGRAVPELPCITPVIGGESVLPLACVDFYGDVSIVAEAAGVAMAERLTKYLAVAAFGTVGCAGIPLRGEVVKRIAVPGTLSESLSIGRAIRQAREAGRDPVEAAVAAVPGARVLLRGAVADRKWENRDGYMWGEHVVEGGGTSLRIWFKNENLLSWLDGEPYVCSPDLIEVVDDESSEPRVNTDLAVGDRVAVLGLPRPAQLGTPEAIAALGPRHWGFDFDFQPIESLA